MRHGADFPENWAKKLQALHCLGVGKKLSRCTSTYCLRALCSKKKTQIATVWCARVLLSTEKSSNLWQELRALESQDYDKCLVFNLVYFFPEPLFHLKASSCVITQVPLCEPMLSCGGAQSISRFSSNSKFGLKLPHPLPH